MNLKFWRAAILGGIVVWLWSCISWNFLPWYQVAVKPFTDEKEVAQVLLDNAPVDGVYRLPRMGSSYSFYPEAGKEREPFFFGVVHPYGLRVNATLMHFLTVLCNIFAAFIVCYLIKSVKGLTFWRQVFLSVLVGLFAGIMLCRNEWGFAGYAAGFVMVSVVDLIIAWFFGGVTIAKLLGEKG